MPWTVGKVGDFFFILIKGQKIINPITKEAHGHISQVEPGRTSTELWVNILNYKHILYIM